MEIEILAWTHSSIEEMAILVGVDTSLFWLLVHSFDHVFLVVAHGKNA
jgi:hypothetical protein